MWGVVVGWVYTLCVLTSRHPNTVPGEAHTVPGEAYPVPGEAYPAPRGRLSQLTWKKKKAHVRTYDQVVLEYS